MNRAPAADEVLTTGQAATFLGVSRQTLVAWLEAGRLPFHRCGAHRPIRRSDVLVYRDRVQSPDNPPQRLPLIAGSCDGGRCAVAGRTPPGDHRGAIVDRRSAIECGGDGDADVGVLAVGGIEIVEPSFEGLELGAGVLEFGEPLRDVVQALVDELSDMTAG